MDITRGRSYDLGTSCIQGCGHFRTIDITCKLGRIANSVCWRLSGYMITWSCAVSFLQREGSIGMLERRGGAIGNIHTLSPMIEK